MIDFSALKSVLYAAVLSDVLDSMGRPNRTMRPFVRPLDEDAVLFGRARTGLFVSGYPVEDGGNPYDVEIELIDALEPDDVPVLACGGPTELLVPWGELLTTAAIQRGAAGAVTDGLVRDVRAIRRLGFPVFHGGMRPLDSCGRGKMVLRDVAVECAGLEVCSGDLVFADVDGVVVIPDAVARETIDRALEKIEGENLTRDEIRAGSLLGEVYQRHGIL